MQVYHLYSKLAIKKIEKTIKSLQISKIASNKD